MIEIPAIKMDRGMVHSGTGHLAVDVYKACGTVYITWVDMFDNEYCEDYPPFVLIPVDPELDI